MIQLLETCCAFVRESLRNDGLRKLAEQTINLPVCRLSLAILSIDCHIN